MVRFRSKNSLAKPTLISENFEAEFQSKLESASQNKEAKTPRRSERVSPAKINSIKTPKLTQRASPAKINSIKTPKRSEKASPEKINSTKTSSRKLSKPNLSEDSSAKAGSIKTPRELLESDCSEDSPHLTLPKPVHLPASKASPFVRKDDEYTIAGIQNDFLEDQHWDPYNIYENSKISTTPAGLVSDEFIPIKEEGGRVFPANDPFGFLQMEREVEQTARANPSKTASAKTKESSATPIKPKVPMASTNSKFSTTPDSRRSTRLLNKPSPISQNKSKENPPSKKASPEKVGNYEGKPKNLRSKMISKPKVPKKTLAETKKILQEERARLIERFKVVDKFHLDEEVV